MAQVDWGRLGALALAMLLAAGRSDTARAQTATTDDRQAVNHQAVGVAPIEGRGFRIGASLRTLYDSNILRLGDGFNLQPGYHRSDFRITPTVSAAAGLPVGRQQLFLGGEFGRDIYARNSQLNRNRYTIDGGAILHAGHSCSGSITGEYNRRQSLLNEASVRTDNTQEIQDYAAVADCAPPIGIGFGGGVTRNVTDNRNVARQLFDSRSTNYDAHLNLGSPVLGQFSAGGNFTRINYPRRLLVTLDGSQSEDKLNIYSGRLSYSKNFGPRISVQASGSYIKVKPDPSAVLNTIIVQTPIGPLPISVPNARAGYSGPGFSLALGYNPSTRLSATLNASRDVTSSPNVGAQFVIRDSIGAAINYAVRPSIPTVIGVDWDHRQYRGSFATTEEPSPRTSDSVTRIYGRASFEPRPLYAVDFELAHQFRSSNPSLYNFSSTSAAVTLRVKFGRG